MLNENDVEMITQKAAVLLSLSRILEVNYNNCDDTIKSDFWVLVSAIKDKASDLSESITALQKTSICRSA